MTTTMRAVQVAHAKGPFQLVERPIPDPPPVTSATRPASGRGRGRRASFASSSAHYSMRNFSLSGIGE